MKDYTSKIHEICTVGLPKSWISKYMITVLWMALDVIFDAVEDNKGVCDDSDVDDDGDDGHDEDETGRGMVSIGSLQRRQTLLQDSR